MKLLSKRNDNEPVQKSAEGNLSAAQKALYEIDWMEEIPNGRHKGKNLKWVKENDDSYYRWCLKEDMQYKWVLIKLKGNAIRPQIAQTKYNQWLNPATGEWYIDIRMNDQVTTPAPLWWYME